MQAYTETALHPPVGLETLRAHRAWFMVLGIVLLMLGLAAIAFPFIAAVAANLLLGWILVIGGIAEIVHVFRLGRVNGRLMTLLLGILTLVVGALLLFFPFSGVLTLTLVIGVFFLVGGAFRIVHAFQWRPASGWGWLLANGILEVLLGVIVLSQWPAAAVWLLGVLVGIDLAFAGASMLTLAAAARRTA